MRKNKQHKKNRYKLLILAAVVCLAAGIAVSWGINHRKNIQAAGEVTAEKGRDAGGDAGNNEKDKEKDQISGQKEKDSASGEAGGASGTGHSSKSKNSGTKQDSEGGQQGNSITFPSRIEGTTLTVKNISSYDGIYLEDGSDSEISGVAAMLVENAGKSDVEYADITVRRGDQTWTFVVSDLPAGEMAVVQEKNKAAYQEGIYTSCTATTAEQDELGMSSDKVKVEDAGEGALQVTNLTEEEIPCVRIFYKFYMEEENAYVGGITYTAKLTRLPAGGTKTVKPSHYSTGNSKIVMVRTYDTVE